MILIILAFIAIAYIGYIFERMRRYGLQDESRVGHWIWGFWNSIWNHIMLFVVTPIVFIFELGIWLVSFILHNLQIVYSTTVDWINIVSVSIAEKYYGRKFTAVQVGDEMIAIANDLENKDDKT